MSRLELDQHLWIGRDGKKKQDWVGEKVELQCISVEVSVNSVGCSVAEMNLRSCLKLGEGARPL